jgi:hypothetical protein
MKGQSYVQRNGLSPTDYGLRNQLKQVDYGKKSRNNRYGL